MSGKMKKYTKNRTYHYVKNPSCYIIWANLFFLADENIEYLLTLL